MKFLSEDHKDLLNFLLHNNVDFILVGGFAVNFHGYNRATGDMDVWIRPGNENKEKLFKALVEIGFSFEHIQLLKGEDFDKPFVFSLWEEPFKVDFLTHISGVKFEEAWEQKVFLPFGKRQIPVLHLHHLVLSKINTGRTRDKADIEELQKIKAHKKNS